MIRLVYIILVMLLIPAACDKDNSTPDLLETLLEERPYELIKLAPWCGYCSDLFYPGVTMFNNSLLKDKKVMELFRRRDCFSALSSKYQTVLMESGGMIAFMQSSKYTPFMEEVVPSLRETLFGYALIMPDDNFFTYGIGSAGADIILNYAKQF